MIRKFFVAGEPQQKGSTRAFPIMRKNKITGLKTPGVAVAPDNPKSKDWQNRVQQAAQFDYSPPVTSGPVAVRLTFYFARPASLPRKVHEHLKQPDVDKLVRAVLDGLKGVVYDDDKQVNDLHARKEYADPGHRPGVEITIEIPDDLLTK